MASPTFAGRVLLILFKVELTRGELRRPLVAAIVGPVL